MFRATLRHTLRLTTRTNLPGRYQLVELLRPLIVQEQPVIAEAYNGLKMELDLHDLIQRQIFFQLYDRSEIAMLSRLIRPGQVFFDVGGNVGLYAISLAQRVGPSGSVHVFEPIPNNLAHIRRNVVLNQLESVITINPLAVSDEESTLELYLPPTNSNSGWASVVPSAMRTQRLNVSTITLDAYIMQRGIGRVDLVKMDIEGAELRALQGMRQLLARDDAPMLYVEINPFLLNKQKIEPQTIKAFLASFGYSLFAPDGERLQPVSVETAERSLRNILATKRALT